jgi:hypothetical protein
MRLLTQSLTIGDQTIEGPVTKFDSLASIINEILKIIFPLALFLLFVYLLWAGFDMVRNLGNPKLVEGAKARITNAIIGIIMLSVSYWAAQIAVKVFFG